MFWFQHPAVLIENLDIWPMPNMDFDSKLNAISRLVIILTVLGYLYTNNSRLLFTGIATLSVIVFMYQQKKTLQSEIREGFSLQDLIPNDYAATYYDSNMNNPLGNILLPEIQDTPKRHEAKPAFNNKTKEEIDENVKKMVSECHPDFPDIDKKPFRDLGDNIELHNSMIPFNSNPNTEIPNNQNAFAKFCYGDMPSFKEAHM